MNFRKLFLSSLTALLLSGGLLVGGISPALPAQTGEPGLALIESRLLRQHPRLLVNDAQWPKIKEQTAGSLKLHFEALQKQSAELPVEPEIKDWGHEALTAAFVYRVTREPQLLAKTRVLLKNSQDFYEQCYAQAKPVNWYSFSRIDWLVALDLIWNEVPAVEWEQLARRMLAHVQQIGPASQKIKGEASSGPRQGFYGPQSIYWFTGLLLLGEGIDDAAAQKLLRDGYTGYEEMLKVRAAIAGNDGGTSSGTLNYALATYPLAEWQFFHSWRSAFGEDMAAQWRYPALLARYLNWNWLPRGREFGYGDAPHRQNMIYGSWLYLHMKSIVHFYGQHAPEAAQLAERMAREVVAAGYTADTTRYRDNYLITGPGATLLPYLLEPQGQTPAAATMQSAKPKVEGMFFKGMGQLFMRSGQGEDDTYLLISGDGVLESPNHRHYDSGSFTLYHRGFLALDSGTRLGQGSHMVNYYGQTVAHSSLLIEMPDEPGAPYWLRKSERQYGGQYRFTGSKVVDFYTRDNWAYAAYDLTPVYRKEKVQEVTRQFVFLAPDTLVIFDRVTSTNPGFAKRWLLHTANEPQINGRQFTAEQGEGRLISTTLLPADALLTAVGGPGKEFLVGDKNYPVEPQNLVRGQVPELMGRWRMEVQPGQPRESDVFLHVLEVGDKTRKSTANPQVETNDENVTLHLVTPDGQAVTLRFNRKGTLGGSITWPGQSAVSLAAVPVSQLPN